MKRFNLKEKIDYKKLREGDRIEYKYSENDNVVGIILKIDFKKKLVWTKPMMRVPTKEFQPFPENLCFYKKWIMFEEIKMVFKNEYAENYNEKS